MRRSLSKIHVLVAALQTPQVIPGIRPQEICEIACNIVTPVKIEEEL